MYNFKNDYSEGCHPNILDRLIDSNLQQHVGYGDDNYSLEAKELIKEKIKNKEASVYFVSGGTQTNLLVISSLLRSHEAVISAETGHIYVHETGAIEAVGHRIIPIFSSDGKLQPSDIIDTLAQYAMRPHVVKPRLVYISNATEIGTIYSKAELQDLYHCCQQHGLLLFMDGARLGHALTAIQTDLCWTDLAKLTDVFYIGATKNGALLGEAIIFNNPQLATDFDYILKQKGALLAKGRLLGIQFLELFRDNLYDNLARHANLMAQKIADTFTALGYEFLTPPTTNQLFPILPIHIIQQLEEKYLFFVWKKIDDHHAAIRLITSWATTDAIVDIFIEDLKALSTATKNWKTLTT